jgi:peptidyl-prolyl cis-trans isomerase D
VSDAETRDAVRYQLEEVKIAAVKLDGRKPPPDLVVPDEAAQALLAKDPERVRRRYEARRSDFDQPEQARVRHILARFEAGDAAAEQAARVRIDAARKRLEGGEDFAAVAKQVSEDPATREKGGDLGFLSRAAVVKPLEQAIFSQAPGAVGDVVQTPQGFHLVLVEERRAARVVPFEEAQLQVASELAQQDAAAAVARTRAEKLSQAVREGGSLVDAARAEGLEILRPDPLRRRPDGYVPSIGAAPELVASAFTLTPERSSDPTIHTADENVFVLIQLLERKGPAEAEVEAALSSTRERLLEQRRSAAEQAWLEQLRQQLNERDELVYDLAAFR